MQHLSYTSFRRFDRAFTLIEMLVVIAIISLLISIVSPSLRGSREAARGIKCMAHMRQLSVATGMFTDEHKERLPGIMGAAWVNRNVSGGGCWLSNPPSGQSYWQAALQTGEIWSYTGTETGIYRCPSLQKGTLGSGVGSNGKFDYSAFHAFAGARIYKLPKDSTIIASGYSDRVVRTPWIIEEAPDRYINTSNIEGGFGGGDFMGNWHNGGANLVAFDGSAIALLNTRDLTSSSFTAFTPSNQLTILASHGSGWGGWDNR